mgnify:CR=1 FL=1
MIRMAKRAGEDLTYTVFSEGARDDYEDVAYTADASAPTVRGVRSTGGSKNASSDVGEVRGYDAAFLFPFPLLDSAGNVVSVEDTDTNRAATLTDSTGVIYEVIGVGRSAETPVGAKRLLCKRQGGT